MWYKGNKLKGIRHSKYLYILYVQTKIIQNLSIANKKTAVNACIISKKVIPLQHFEKSK